MFLEVFMQIRVLYGGLKFILYYIHMLPTYLTYLTNVFKGSTHLSIHFSLFALFLKNPGIIFSPQFWYGYVRGRRPYHMASKI